MKLVLGLMILSVASLMSCKQNEEPDVGSGFTVKEVKQYWVTDDEYTSLKTMTIDQSLQLLNKKAPENTLYYRYTDFGSGKLTCENYDSHYDFSDPDYALHKYEAGSYSDYDSNTKTASRPYASLSADLTHYEESSLSGVLYIKRDSYLVTISSSTDSENSYSFKYEYNNNFVSKCSYTKKGNSMHNPVFLYESLDGNFVVKFPDAL